MTALPRSSNLSLARVALVTRHAAGAALKPLPLTVIVMCLLAVSQLCTVPSAWRSRLCALHPKTPPSPACPCALALEQPVDSLEDLRHNRPP